ncbi:MAG: glutamate--tRNA ligase [Candidatus Daviesbacteria bacterium]|nr:glutamate--tRNA ligase [Candidatus Daviesbacteria bacterium]
MKIKTRFAPSPTGVLHIGGVRTALYAYLVAKKAGGVFSLRIEDTDRARFVEGATEDIIKTLKWLGLTFDGEPIYQSRRVDLYKEQVEKLVDCGKAYEKDGAVWFKVQLSGKTSIVDLAGGRKIEFENSTQKDFVILKSDGYPTYHLAHVVDDHLMETNPVIRGAEWISSVPKHIQLFEAFGWEIPQYAHLPIILGTDRSKLSKRHGAKPASEFREDGFLAEAILNYMALLGWTPPSGKEILTLSEMVKEFDLSDVNSANPIFDITKLEWMNGEYIRKSQISNLKSQILEYLKDLAGGVMPDHPTEEELEKVAPLVKDRIKKLSDFIPLTDFLWEKVEYDKEIFNRLKIDDLRLKMEKVLKKMGDMEKPWKADMFEKTFRGLADEMGVKAGDMFQLIRVAISGQTVTPPLFESIEIIGEEEIVKRIKAAIEFLQTT